MCLGQDMPKTLYHLLESLDWPDQELNLSHLFQKQIHS